MLQHEYFDNSSDTQGSAITDGQCDTTHQLNSCQLFFEAITQTYQTRGALSVRPCFIRLHAQLCKSIVIKRLDYRTAST